MACLANDTAALRLRVDLVQRERTPPARVLASAAVEYLDRRDGEQWPLVRLPPLWLLAGAAEALVDAVERVVRGDEPGFAWQSGPEAALGVQVLRTPGGAQVEVGVDLSTFLAEVAGPPPRPGAELALFRFAATQADLVRFGGALRDELGALG